MVLLKFNVSCAVYSIAIVIATLRDTYLWNVFPNTDIKLFLINITVAKFLSLLNIVTKLSKNANRVSAK